jgi:hypothetical protein
MTFELFQQIKSLYPKRSGGQGWGHVPKLLARAVAQGATQEEILEGVRAYRRWCDFTGKTGTEYVKQASTFFGPGQWWAEEYDAPATGKPDPSFALEAKYDADAARLGEPKRQAGETLEQYRERLAVAIRRSLVRVVR